MPRRENLPEKERFNCLLKRFNNNTASGLLNLRAALTKTVAFVIPGRSCPLY
jgi:hypothetical protein